MHPALRRIEPLMAEEVAALRDGQGRDWWRR
jgi:hypothetical protein